MPQTKIGQCALQCQLHIPYFKRYFDALGSSAMYSTGLSRCIFTCAGTRPNIGSLGPQHMPQQPALHTLHVLHSTCMCKIHLACAVIALGSLPQKFSHQIPPQINVQNMSRNQLLGLGITFGFWPSGRFTPVMSQYLLLKTKSCVPPRSITTSTT